MTLQEAAATRVPNHLPSTPLRTRPASFSRGDLALGVEGSAPPPLSGARGRFAYWLPSHNKRSAQDDAVTDSGAVGIMWSRPGRAAVSHAAGGCTVSIFTGSEEVNISSQNVGRRLRCSRPDLNTTTFRWTAVLQIFVFP